MIGKRDAGDDQVNRIGFHAHRFQHAIIVGHAVILATFDAFHADGSGQYVSHAQAVQPMLLNHFGHVVHHVFMPLPLVHQRAQHFALGFEWMMWIPPDALAEIAGFGVRLE